MTGTTRPTAGELLRAVENAEAEDEAARIALLDDDALDRELAVDGFDPAAVRARGQAIAMRATPAKRVRPALVLAVAAGLLLLVTAAAERRAIVAWFAPQPIEKEPIERDHGAPNSVPVPSAAELTADVAARLRDEAFAACAAGLWVRCRTTLDQARALDPAGEADPRVQGARRHVLAALAPPEPSRAQGREK